jgi:hypothetical protein
MQVSAEYDALGAIVTRYQATLTNFGQRLTVRLKAPAP